MKHRSEFPQRVKGQIPDPQAQAQWPELPLYQRDPSKTCGTCHHLVRMQLEPTDIQGKLFCKWGPPNVTSVTLPTGQFGGVSQPFCPASPLQWCDQWKRREKERETPGGLDSDVIAG